jgi:hypothetical protein
VEEYFLREESASWSGGEIAGCFPGCHPRDHPSRRRHQPQIEIHTPEEI